jgi:transcriptional regulator with XRE-family HTH domain
LHTTIGHCFKVVFDEPAIIRKNPGIPGKKGFSQDELSEIMEVNRSTISKVETGKFAITIDYLVKFAWYLDFDISVLEKLGK